MSPSASASMPPSGYSSYSSRLCRKAGENGTEPAVSHEFTPATGPCTGPGLRNKWQWDAPSISHPTV